MAEPCYACDGDGYDPFIDGKSAGNCTRCKGGGTERALTCDICGESEGVTPDICPMQGNHKGNFCKACGPSEEPGDSYYEGRA